MPLNHYVTLSRSGLRVSLAWVQARPGATSTIIGARTMQQLEDNLGALDVQLSAAELDRLNELSKPALNFPVAFLENGGMFVHGGTTINGRYAPPWPMAPKDDSERY